MFSKTQPGKDLVFLLEYQKWDLTVVDCHGLEHGIRGKVFLILGLFCFAIFGLDVKADGRS